MGKLEIDRNAFVKSVLAQTEDRINVLLEDYDKGYRMSLASGGEVRIGPDAITRDVVMTGLISSVQLNIQYRMLDMTIKYCK